MKAVEVRAPTILEEIMPAESVELDSTTNMLGFSGATNELVVKFKPKTTMSPSGRGFIKIGIPYWY